MNFQIYSRVGLRGRRWYWRLRAGNNKIIAQGEGYRNRADAIAAVNLVRSSADAGVGIEGLPG